MLITKPTHLAYSAMGNGRSDYDAFYGVSEMENYFGWHFHDFYELYIHLGGAEYYCIENNTYIMEPNQLYIIPPYTMHGLMANTLLKRYERTYIYLLGEFMKTLSLGQIDLERMIGELTQNERYVFSISEDAARECARHIQQVHLDKEDVQPWKRFSDISHILPALRIILEAANAPREVAANVNPDSDIGGIMRYIGDHFTEPLSLRTLAERFSISPSSLSHRFTQYARHSVYEYILYKRIMMAKYLIIQNESLSDVAFRCGFGDYSNFLRAFKKICGFSPIQYKKAARSLRNI